MAIDGPVSSGGAKPEKCEGKRVAVVGSGITGVSSAWLLRRSGAKVTLFEKESAFGGHTLTDETSPYPVDLGFQVFNLTTYPNLVGFFEHLGVDHEPSDMSFSLSVDGGRLEWGSDGLSGLFAQRRNILSPSFWRMIWDVLRFGREAPEVLSAEGAAVHRDMTLGNYLSAKGYSRGFILNYVVPMCAAVWSVPNAQVLEFPVRMLVQFWVNHHLLSIFQRPVWRIVKGRSRSYVLRALEDLEDVRRGCPVRSIRRLEGGGVAVSWGDGGDEETFDAVVLATHSDTALSILGTEATKEEAEVLSAIPYNENDVYLHGDESLMPKARNAWASWNFLGNSSSEHDTKAVCVSYWLNRLQHLPEEAPPLFCTLNPLHPPAENKIIRRLSLGHPVYSFEAVRAQKRIGEIQGTGGVYYAGAWCGYGFHEDGIKAGIAAARALGAEIPWVPRPCNPELTLWQRFCMETFDRFCRQTITSGSLRFILPNGSELRYGDGVNPPMSPKDAWRGKPPLEATVRVLDASFFPKVLARHDTGMGESYMDGDYEVNSLGGLLAIATANARNIEGNRGKMGVLNWLGDRMLHLAHLGRGNTIEGSRKNIEEHYDAGNAMYKLFLDDTMTYSCGIHGPGVTLEDAQYAKLDAMIQRAGIKEGDKVLEIGCGWGSMAMRAASTTGCHVTGLTLSKEQLAEATARVKAAGLQDRVKLMFCDYRDCPGAGTFDAVLSCEMIEAVGHEHLDTYFAQIGSMLKPGGKAVIQVIAEPDERYEAYCNSSDFIREHIFPGGHLPSMGAMVEAAKGTGLAVHECYDIGPDYAITLRAWRDAWERRKAEVLELGYSERFWRKYRFYFAYCEAAFDAKYIHDFHITWVKDPRAQTEPTPAKEAPVTSDPVVQGLLAIYFFLAGLAVTQHPFLWIVPVTTLCFAVAAASAGAAASVLGTGYRLLPEKQKAYWRANAVNLMYSTVAGMGAAWHAISNPKAAWSLAPGAVDGRDAQLAELPTVLCCLATGFNGYMLYAMVHDRLLTQRYKALAHHTILLVLFGCAVYKRVHMSLLCTALIGELSNIFVAFGRLTTDGSTASLTHTMKRLTVPVLTLLPHCYMTFLVATTPSAFNPSHWIMALLGLVYMNWSSILLTRKTMREATKTHTA